MFDPIDYGRGEITGWVEEQREEGGTMRVLVKIALGVLGIVVISSVVLVSLVGIQDDAGAVRVLSDMGYSQIRTHIAMPWECGEHDLFMTGFDALSPAGKLSRGVVCSVWFNSSTIRVD